jgi:hypothetical protein
MLLTLVDHTSGLSPSWNNGTIYCSHMTKALLLHKFKLNPALVISLDEDDTHQVNLDTFGKATMQVTLIDANHCPGSCMFLLQGYFGNILLSGDFRFDPLILQHHALQNKQIDHLYLDDTFLAPQYEFPTRKDAGSEILNIISKYSEKTRFLVGVDTLGKEELLVALGVALKSLVVVDSERLEMLSVMQKHASIPDIFTDRPNEGRIHVVSKREVNIRRIQEMRLSAPTIGISASGWSCANIQEYKKYKDPWIHRVAYSLHSSYSELVEFVRALKPRFLYSGSRHDNCYVRKFLGQYCLQDSSDFIIEIPRSVKLAMESKKQTMYNQHQVVLKKPKRTSITKSKGLRISSKQIDHVDLSTQVIESEDDESDNEIEEISSIETTATSQSGINKLLDIMDEDIAPVVPYEASQETLSLIANLEQMVSNNESTNLDKKDSIIEVEKFKDVFSYSKKERSETYNTWSLSMSLVPIEPSFESTNEPPAIVSRIENINNQKKTAKRKLESLEQPPAKKSKSSTIIPEIKTTFDLMNVPLSLDGFDLFPQSDNNVEVDPAEALSLSPIRDSPPRRKSTGSIADRKKKQKKKKNVNNSTVTATTTEAAISSVSQNRRHTITTDKQQREQNQTKKKATTTTVQSIEVVDLTTPKKKKRSVPFLKSSNSQQQIVSKLLSQANYDCIIID